MPAKTYTLKSNLIFKGKLLEKGGAIAIDDEDIAADLLKRDIIAEGKPKAKKEDEGAEKGA